MSERTEKRLRAENKTLREVIGAHSYVEATPLRNGEPITEPEVLVLRWLGRNARAMRRVLEAHAEESE